MRSGITRGAGPSETKISTAEPLITSCPATRFGCNETSQRRTIPAGISSSLSGASVPNFNPLFVKVAIAVAASRPFNSGSGTGGGPVDTINVSFLPDCKSFPFSGSVRITDPTAMRSSGCSTVTTFHLNSVTKFVACPCSRPIKSGTGKDSFCSVLNRK